MNRKPKLDRRVQEDLTRITDFDAALIKALATFGNYVHVPLGWAIFREMTPGDSIYILLHGNVEIRKAGEFRSMLGPGDVFGEIALTDHRLRSASVVASTDITAVRVESSVVQTLSETYPAFADALRSSAGTRLKVF